MGILVLMRKVPPTELETQVHESCTGVLRSPVAGDHAKRSAPRLILHAGASFSRTMASNSFYERIVMFSVVRCLGLRCHHVLAGFIGPRPGEDASQHSVRGAHLHSGLYFDTMRELLQYKSRYRVFWFPEGRLVIIWPNSREHSFGPPSEAL